MSALRRVIKINDIRGEFYYFSCETDLDPMTEAFDTYPPIDVAEAKRILDDLSTHCWMSASPTNMIGSIQGSTNIPINTIPQHLENISKRTLLIYCHHGGRSLQVTHFLRQNGFENAINVEAASMHGLSRLIHQFRDIRA